MTSTQITIVVILVFLLVVAAILIFVTPRDSGPKPNILERRPKKVTGLWYTRSHDVRWRHAEHGAWVNDGEIPLPIADWIEQKSNELGEDPPEDLKYGLVIDVVR